VTNPVADGDHPSTDPTPTDPADPTPSAGLADSGGSADPAGSAGSGGVGGAVVLVVDTATPAVTAAVVRLGGAGGAGGGGAVVEVLAAEVVVDARAHGEKLAPGIRAALGAAGVAAGELVAVVAGTGPGPFTGLRVGLVTATAMGQALGVPCYGVCSLDGIGAAAGPGRVVVATDARRREVYWAVYADGVRQDGPQVTRPAELPGIATADRAVGDGALLHAEQLGLPVVAEPRYPDPGALAALVADRVLAGAPGEPLTPLYLRRPDVAMPGARKTVLS
jgi:tRNA threonylcarbamoyl adenosine modification protein YeaZ